MLTAKQLNSTVPYALPEELEWISDYAQHLHPNDSIVMLGAGPGVFALALVENNLVLEDLTVIDHDTTHWTEQHLRGAGYAGGTFLVGDSADEAALYLTSVEFLIVDADHSYEGVKRDINAWWSLVYPGGIVFFHDYLERQGGFDGSGEWYPGGVAKAIEELKDDSWELVTQVGISIVYRKIGK